MFLSCCKTLTRSTINIEGHFTFYINKHNCITHLSFPIFRNMEDGKLKTVIQYANFKITLKAQETKDLVNLFKCAVTTLCLKEIILEDTKLLSLYLSS